MVTHSKFHITKEHFSLNNRWEIHNPWDTRIEEWTGEWAPKFILDTSTGDRYLNEHPNLIRLKCGGVALASTHLHPVAAAINTLFLACKILTLRHFLSARAKEQTRDERLYELAHDISRIALTPLCLVGIFCSALYGIYDPLNGRKLVATLERFVYHSSIVAECFQPSAPGYKRATQWNCIAL